MHISKVLQLVKAGELRETYKGFPGAVVTRQFVQGYGWDERYFARAADVEAAEAESRKESARRAAENAAQAAEMRRKEGTRREIHARYGRGELTSAEANRMLAETLTA